MSLFEFSIADVTSKSKKGCMRDYDLHKKVGFAEKPNLSSYSLAERLKVQGFSEAFLTHFAWITKPLHIRECHASDELM